MAERLYRVLYDGLLSRLPEARAVALGQAFLRRLPVEAVPGLAVDDPRLAVDLAGVRLPNPVILSAMYYDLAILRKAMALGFGAVTTKTITVTPRPGHPEPNLVRIATPAGPGFVNCNGFKNPGLEAFRAALPALPRRRPLIVSVAGESPAEYRRLVEALAGLGDLVELNISSPNTRLVYEVSASPARVRELFRSVRGATDRPIVVKLSPDFPEQNRRAIVPAILETGIHAINFGNTRRVEDRRLSQGAGGLSGPALFDEVLATVRELRRTVGPGVGLIATGGIDTPARALAALEAGADAVSYFTAFVTRGPTLPRRIGEALVRTLEARRLGRVGELTAGVR
ncbi:MAG: dihydroorotate dehydrogenase [Candidatus Rokuibacteriota bacterium]